MKILLKLIGLILLTPLFAQSSTNKLSLKQIEDEIFKLQNKQEAILGANVSLETKQGYVDELLELRGQLHKLSEEDGNSTTENIKKPIFYLNKIKVRKAEPMDAIGAHVIPSTVVDNYQDGVASWETVITHPSDDVSKETNSFAISALPSVIKVGESFSFNATYHRQVIRASDECSRNSKGHTDAINIYMSLNFSAQSSDKSILQSKGIKEPNVPCEIDASGRFTHKDYKAGLALDLAVKCNYVTNSKSIYNYICKGTGKGATDNNVMKASLGSSYLGTGGLLSTSFRFKRILLEYSTKNSGYKFKLGNINSELINEIGGIVSARADDDLIDNPNDTSSDGTDNSTNTTINSTGNNTANQNTIKPNSAKISQFISQWIDIAQPPSNATKGNQLKYEKWGRTIGKTTTNTAQVKQKPSDVAGRTSSEYLWSMRDKLDSVDHCTLGEYVLAKISNKSLSFCVGRYKKHASNEKNTKPESMPNVHEVEPNNNYKTASTIKSNTHIISTILPSYDKDFYKFEASHQGELTVEIISQPKGLNLELRLHPKPDGSILTYSDNSAKGDGKIVIDIPQAGTYYLEVISGSYKSSVEKYDLKMSFIPSPDKYGENNSYESAADVPINGNLIATILPKYDKDFYKFKASHQGELTVEIISQPKDLNLELSLHPKPDGSIQTYSDNSAKNDGKIVIDIPQAGTYYLEVNSGSYNRSVEDYKLSLNFQ